MIYDTFLFGGGETEHALLQMRLEELSVVPDLVHVLVEAPYDHQGKAKTLWYAEHKSGFAAYADRIVSFTAEVPGPADISPWVREHSQREGIRQALFQAGAQPQDLVLLCDVDELPSLGGIEELTCQELPCLMTLCMDMSMFAVDWLLPAQQEIAVAGYFGDLARFPLGLMRHNSYRKANPQIPDAGHHFSWLGGPPEIERKCGYFCHEELRNLILAGNEQGCWYERGLTWYSEAWTHRDVPPDKTIYSMVPVSDVTLRAWPALIREHRCPEIWFRPPESRTDD